MKIVNKFDEEEGRLLFWVDETIGGPIIYADTVEEGEAKVKELVEFGEFAKTIVFLNEVDMEDAYRMIEMLSIAPDSQIDTSITTRLANLIGKPLEEVKTEVRHILDDCVFGSLASDFGIISLNILYEIKLGGKKEDFLNDEINPWRKEMMI